MRIFKSKWFARFAQKEGIDDDKLRRAVKEVEQRKLDVDYGGGVIKQRIARDAEGKSRGYRTIILFRRNDKAFFVYGFSKNKRENIQEKELRIFKDSAKEVFCLSEKVLNDLLIMGAFKELKYDDEVHEIQE